MGKIYTIELEGIRIGTTKFEFADTPMGVVQGKVNFVDVESPYELFRAHCNKYNIQINEDDPKYRMIDTVVIPELKVYLNNGKELKGWGAAITGIENGEFEIQFGGIDLGIMQTEFAHHYFEDYGEESGLIKINVNKEFIEICEAILSRNLSIEEWAKIESSDEFQTDSYCGGFDATEMEFCFSYFKEGQEYWFQKSMKDIVQIIKKEIDHFFAKRAE